MLNKMRKNANEKGFTLIELMIVIAIIGILAAIAVPNFIAFRDKGYCSAAESDAKSLGAAIADYFSVPSRKELPTITGQNEVTFSASNVVKLSSNNTATITKKGANQYQIAVTDASQRCPKEYKDASPRWNGDVYSFTI